MIGFILANWRIFAIIAAVLTVLGGLAVIKRNIYQDGYKTCRADVATEQMINNTLAQDKIKEVQNKYEVEIQRIVSEGDSGYGVGSVTSGVLDRMPKRAVTDN